MNTTISPSLEQKPGEHESHKAWIRPYIPAAKAAVAGLQLGPCELAHRVSAALKEMPDSLDWSDPAVKEARAKEWANYYALQDLVPCTPPIDLLEAHLRAAREGLYRLSLAHYHFVVLQEREAEEEEKSAALKAAEEAFNARLKEVGDRLSYTLSPEQVAFASEVDQRFRHRRRFRVSVTTTKHERGWRLWEVPMSIPYRRIEFVRLIEHARTLDECKRICWMWHTPATARRVEATLGCPAFTKLVAEHFAVLPC